MTTSFAVELALDAGALVLEGEAQNVALRKLVLERVAAHPAVAAIVDRLRIMPVREERSC